MLALPRLRPATTAPLFGEIVRVLLALAVTEETALPPCPVTHTPLTAKHPLVIFTPLPKVEEAVKPVRFKYVADTPPAKVEVAPSPRMVVVEVRPEKRPFKVDMTVVEALPRLV